MSSFGAAAKRSRAMEGHLLISAKERRRLASRSVAHLPRGEPEPFISSFSSDSDKAHCGAAVR